MKSELMTTKEVAEYLSINEKQVYRLVKERKIPATRITGKWLFPKPLIDEWVLASAKGNLEAAPKRQSSGNQLVIAGSNDFALELLAKNLNARRPEYAVSISSVGSLAGLVALQNGNCHIASSHLLDAETGDYNSAFIKKHFPDLKVIVQNLVHREQGLIVSKGNPRKIKGLKDLIVKKIDFVNRQEGSGTRVLLDYKLRESGIDPTRIRGYSRMVHTHLDVALEVFRGSAHAGMGILAAARLLDLDFIPLATERFDLIMANDCDQPPTIKNLRALLCSDEFKLTVTRMGGYSTRDTGRIMYERA
jgi:putative molybdopterin biosynthesis protein